MPSASPETVTLRTVGFVLVAGRLPQPTLVLEVAVSTVQGAEITTLEGLATDGKLHPLQQAWIDEQVPACGFCQNGQIMTAKALLDRTPNPTDVQIREGMARTLCRCMTYYRVQLAIKRASRTMRAWNVGSKKEVTA